MLQCVEKPVCFALFALASVSLFYSQTVASAETKITPKLNKTGHQNTTHNFTHNEPQVLPLHRVCSGEHNSYCINGHCSVLQNFHKPSCTCHVGFIGERCEHMDLRVFSVTSTPPYAVEEEIAVSCGVILLLVCVCVLGCCCYRKWGRKPAPPYKNQENSV